MARIRTIKPSFWADECVADLSRDARLLLIGLISVADDDGRFIATPTAVAGYVYPHDEISPVTIKKWMREIEVKMRRNVTFYDVAGRKYGAFRKYRTHQKINRPQSSTLPPPPGEETLL